MAQVPAWKIGRIPQKTQVNLVDLLSSARNFYNNRFDIVDKTVQNYQDKQKRGELSDLQFLNALKSIANRQKGGFNPEAAAGVQDLAQQQSEAISKQVYNDYIETQKRNIQKTLDAADVKFAAVQEDFNKGRISEPAYMAQRNAYFELQKNKADLENLLPKYSYQQFQPGAPLNTYQSGRLRDIERERQIRDAFKSTFGKDISANYLYETAGSYLPVSTIQQIYNQQKIAGQSGQAQGGIPGDFKFSEPKYNFPGLGGRPQLPTENYGRRNYYR